MQHKIAFVLVVLLSSLATTTKAQAPSATLDYEVRPLSDYFAEYRDKRRVILEAIRKIEGDTDARLAEYDKQMGKLRDNFRASRLVEYRAVVPERTVAHSCSSKSSGGKKNCGWKCVANPSPDHFPVPESITVKGANKGTRINKDGGVCLKMTVSGRHKNSGQLHVNYRFKPEVIERRLYDDSKRLFDIIGTQG